MDTTTDIPTVGADDPRWHALGLHYVRLHRWTTAGWLHPVGDLHPGSGGRRRWPVSEIAVAARMQQLIEAGFTPPAAARLARTDGRRVVDLPGDLLLVLPASMMDMVPA